MWETTLESVGARYGGASKLVVTLQAESESASGQSPLTMRDLCQRLHGRAQRGHGAGGLVVGAARAPRGPARTGPGEPRLPCVRANGATLGVLVLLRSIGLQDPAIRPKNQNIVLQS